MLASGTLLGTCPEDLPPGTFKSDLKASTRQLGSYLNLGGVPFPWETPGPAASASHVTKANA